MCTSFAPASRRLTTRARAVVPRTIESSTTTTRFPFHRFLDQVQFHPHVEIANELARLEKGAPDVVIAHEGVLVGNVQLVREAERGVVSGVGHRHDDVGFDRKSSRQFASHFGAHLGDVDAADDAVGPREINVLEHAKGRLLLAETAIPSACRLR